MRRFVLRKTQSSALGWSSGDTRFYIIRPCRLVPVSEASATHCEREFSFWKTCPRRHFANREARLRKRRSGNRFDCGARSARPSRFSTVVRPQEREGLTERGSAKETDSDCPACLLARVVQEFSGRTKKVFGHGAATYIG